MSVSARSNGVTASTPFACILDGGMRRCSGLCLREVLTAHTAPTPKVSPFRALNFETSDSRMELICGSAPGVVQMRKVRSLGPSQTTTPRKTAPNSHSTPMGSKCQRMQFRDV
jgi:hypothetical protein